MHLVIRADGGSEIGYGHLIRSNALSEEALLRDHTITVATTTPQPAQSVFPDAVEIIKLLSRSDPEPLVDYLDANQPGAVFTDSYPIDTEYQCAVRDRTLLTVFQDDDRHAVCADLFVNGNLHTSDLGYEFVGQKPETYLGTDYMLLRSEICERAEDEPPQREYPERVLVSIGGSDITDLMPTVIRAFAGFEIQIDAIVGPGFSKEQEQETYAAAEGILTDISVMRDPNDLVERMFQADFAVSRSSLTTYELLALGTPIVSVPVADDQEPVARSLREYNAGIVLERMANKEAFRCGIERYISDSKFRRECREHGQKLVDCKGSTRVVEAMKSHIDSNTNCSVTQ